MKKSLFFTLLTALLVTSTALAQRLPAYYPAEGFQRTGVIDAVYVEDNRVVIDDIPYQMSESVRVHSLSSESDSIARIRPGAHVGYKIAGSSRVIIEFWLLPSTYQDGRRR